MYYTVLGPRRSLGLSSAWFWLNPIPHLMGWSPPHFDFECFPLLQRLKLLGGNQMTIKNKVFAKSGCHFFYDSLSKTMKKSNFKLPRQKFWSFLGNFHQLVV